ncbi:MAG: substrate-binding domain-containing protein [Prevotellaceae bacterium]|jgi:phosphate transport system substrate-binding protein|nr:substrate-binding domain-containing protein [Prevotellaceae bacterium]
MRYTYLYSFLFVLLLCSCGNRQASQQNLSTVSSGKTIIAVDESFRPIIEKEIVVFENKYVEAEVEAVYTNEVSVIDLLVKDSVQLAIATRPLTNAEKKSLESKKLFARELKLATDGIAIITNRKNSDTLISVPQLQQIMTGEVTKWNGIFPASKLGNIALVFDNSRSSTVRFAIDSICKDKPLSNKLYAQQTNEEVIEYVSKTPNAIGVIGVSWLSNKADSLRISFINNVKLMSVSRTDSPNEFNSYQPFQAYLALRQYPLTRDIYVILTEPRNGLSTGFMTFLASDIGQRVILKEGIVPATQNVSIRSVNVRNQ